MKRSTVPGTPEANGLVFTAAGDEPPITTERHGPDCAAVSFQCSCDPSVGNPPDTNHRVIASCEEPQAIRPDVDRSDALGMLEDMDQLSILNTPQLHGCVDTARCE